MPARPDLTELERIPTRGLDHLTYGEWASVADALPFLLAEARKVEAAEAELERLQADLDSVFEAEVVELRAQVETLRETLERISLLDGANAPAGVPTDEFLRSIARAALEGAGDDH